MTFTLSLISTERSNVKLITQNEADAQIIMKDATLFVESGDFESLDYQFSITKNEFNNFDRFSGASYKAIETPEWKTIGGVEYLMTVQEKGVEVENIESVNKKDDELFNTFDDDFLTDDTDDFSDFGGIDVGYNPDEI